MRSSNVRRGGAKRRRTPGSPSKLSFPDPRRWPAEAVRVHRELKRGCGPWDVAIFEHEYCASMYLEDAVTAVMLLDIDPAEWHVENGYPVFTFAKNRIEGFCRRLTGVGYRVRLLNPIGDELPLTTPANVFDIEAARKKIAAKTKGTIS